MKTGNYIFETLTNHEKERLLSITGDISIKELNVFLNKRYSGLHDFLKEIIPSIIYEKNIPFVNSLIVKYNA